jgi:hypothetical protein
MDEHQWDGIDDVGAELRHAELRPGAGCLGATA